MPRHLPTALLLSLALALPTLHALAQEDEEPPAPTPQTISLSEGEPLRLPIEVRIPEATNGPPSLTCAAARNEVPPPQPIATAGGNPYPRDTPPPEEEMVHVDLGDGLTSADSLPGWDLDSIGPTPLEGPESALERIRAVLRRADSGQRVRMSFWGASHVGGEFMTGHIRRLLQDRYGDLGHGFRLPAALYRGYRGQDVNLCRSDDWVVDWAGHRRGHGDGLLGFAGMSVTSEDPGQFGWIETTHSNPHGRRVSQYHVFALGAPEAGVLRYRVDATEWRSIELEREQNELVHLRIEVPDGGHRLTLSPGGDGQVRVFGVSSERDGGGVLVDGMGIRGMQAKTWLRWDEDLFHDGVQALSPDMVVLAYGTNEANASNYDFERYREDLREVLAKMRRAAPDAACVLMGPSDRAKRISGDNYVIWDRTAPVAQVQREVAPEFDCAFWDWQAATGGPGSMLAWRFREPQLGSNDLIHFTRAGYEWVGDRFVESLDALR